MDDDEKLSVCCGAGPENDEGICPACGEHTEFWDQDDWDAEDQAASEKNWIDPGRDKPNRGGVERDDE